jgi:hypothetical protein
MVTRPSATPETFAKAKATTTTAKCLTEDATLTVPAKERSAIEMAAVSYLIDVPAGTNVDVKLATYSTDRVTGSDHYPVKYGNYNFAMVKQSEGWVITDFKRCS